MVSHRSKILRRHSSLLHPSFRRAPEEGTAGLRNPASCDLVRERGDQVFGESSRSTADNDHFPNDDFFLTSATSSSTTTWPRPRTTQPLLQLLQRMHLSLICIRSRYNFFV